MGDEEDVEGKPISKYALGWKAEPLVSSHFTPPCISHQHQKEPHLFCGCYHSSSILSFLSSGAHARMGRKLMAFSLPSCL